jgi:hypothetical protein
MGKQVESVELKAEGVAKFLSDMRKAEIQYDKTTGRFRDTETGRFVAGTTNEFLKLASVLGGSGAAAGGIALGAAAGVAMAAITALQKVMQGAINLAKQFISTLVQVGQEGLMLAGRFEEAGLAALAIGRAMGLSEQEIRDGIDTINEAGIRYDKAAEAAAKFARNQIDLAQAGDLVKVAQATGILIDEDSTETMERLTDAIVTGNTARLTALQITVDNQKALKTHADSLNKDVKALTQQEEVQARVNAILEQSANIMDVYDAAMMSPTKRLRSFTGRELPELKAGLMEAFLPAFSAVIGDSSSGIRGFVNALTEATKEGGALYPILVKLGAAASLVADGFSAALNYISANLPAIISIIDKQLGNIFMLVFNPGKAIAETAKMLMGIENELNRGLGQTAEDMFRWGAEIVAALAEGMVSAAYDAIDAMANVVSGLLSFWMAPGSPPRIAPNIDKWGAATMAEYLRGFTDADFSVLKTVQSALGNFLSPKAMTGLSKALIGDIAAGGGIGETFFDRIAKSAGIFGVEVAKLARAEFELAKATKAMDDANRKYESAQTKVAKSVHEYNQLLREGATQQELDAKLAEVRAAEQEKAAAAQEKAAAAQDTGDLQEQVALQRQLVDHLAQLFKGTKEGAAGVAASVGKSLNEIMTGVGAGGKWDISSKIGEAIDAMKEQLKAKFADIFKPLVEAFGRIQTMIFGGIEEGAPVEGMVAKFDRMIADIQTIIDNLSWENFKSSIQTAREKVEEEGGLLQFYMNYYGGVFERIFGISIPDAVRMMGGTVQLWFRTNMPSAVKEFDSVLNETLKPTLEFVRDLIGGDTESVYAALWKLAGKLAEYLTGDGALALFLKYLGDSESGLIWALEQIADIFWRSGGIIEGVTTVARVVLEAAKAWHEFTQTFDAGAAAAAPFIGHSPSPLEIGITGATRALPDLAAKMRELTRDVSTAFPVTTARPVMGQPAATDNSRSYQGTANVGPNYFNTPIDVATVEIIATRAVRKALQGV